jgi:DNA-binding transcriptional ArsR family regulator
MFGTALGVGIQSTLHVIYYNLIFWDTRVSVMMRIVAQTGPLTSLFGDPHGRAIAKVLDQSILVGNMEQTIRMLADSTELDYKTVQSSLRKLEGLGLVKKGRKVGNAQTYRFNVEHHLHDLVNFARKMQLTPKRR